MKVLESPKRKQQKEAEYQRNKRIRKIRRRRKQRAEQLAKGKIPSYADGKDDDDDLIKQNQEWVDNYYRTLADINAGYIPAGGYAEPERWLLNGETGDSNYPGWSRQLPEVSVVAKLPEDKRRLLENDRLQNISKQEPVSGTDPVGKTIVETIALSPLFKPAERMMASALRNMPFYQKYITNKGMDKIMERPYDIRNANLSTPEEIGQELYRHPELITWLNESNTKDDLTLLSNFFENDVAKRLPVKANAVLNQAGADAITGNIAKTTRIGYAPFPNNSNVSGISTGGDIIMRDVLENAPQEIRLPQLAHELHHELRKRTAGNIQSDLSNYVPLNQTRIVNDVPIRENYIPYNSKYGGGYYSGQEATALDNAYQFSQEFLEPRPNLKPLLEKGATNTGTRMQISLDHNNAVGDQLDYIIDNLSDAEIIQYVKNSNLYGKDFLNALNKVGPSIFAHNARIALKTAAATIPTAGIVSGTDEFKHGKDSGIHIKKSKRGTFTRAAKQHGMGVQEFARKVLNAPKGKYSSAMRKKANFARNASKFKH